jgi:hypothetical protein
MLTGNPAVLSSPGFTVKAFPPKELITTNDHPFIPQKNVASNLHLSEPPRPTRPGHLFCVAAGALVHAVQQNI